MENQALINSIYKAIEGEGVHIGTSQIFVRYQGCAIGCVNCDSMDTWDFSNNSIQSLTKILDTVDDISAGKIHRVSITGGDPLHPKHVPSVVQLVEQFRLRNYFINIEASGMRVVPEVFDKVDFISFDFKTPSTGVKTPIRNLVRLCEEYEGRFQIKAVIEDEADFMACFYAYEDLQKQTLKMDFPWCLTPAFSPGESFNQERFVKIMDLNQEFDSRFRVIGQQHKWVYGPDLKQI